MAEREGFLRKADESLTGAALEFDAAFYNNCANRCYYATFQAAIFALTLEGIVSRNPNFWAHDFVWSEFVGQLVNRRKVYPADLRGVLDRNYALRRMADYQEQSVGRTEASRALQRTRGFVAAIHRRQEER